MTEYEEHKRQLSNQLAWVGESNAGAIVEGIELMIDLRVAELLDEMNKVLEKLNKV